METKNINELTPNVKNPRIISKHDYAALKKSIQEFGDLSGIVFNVTTQRLVGGHQRTTSFKDLAGEKNIVITQRFDGANSFGTVAVGYLTYKSEFFAYREVAWDEAREMAANIAANRIQGQFDNDLLAEAVYDIKQADESLLALTGQTEKEIENLLKASGAIDSDDEAQEDFDDTKLVFKLTAEQKQLIQQAIEHARITRDIPSSNPDAMNGSALYYIAEAYLAEATPLTPEQDPGNFVPPEIPTIG
jgi:hypothetical protein